MINEVTKKFFYPIIFAIALICGPVSAFADESVLNVRARIICADEINCDRAVRLFREAAAYIRSAVKVEIKVVEVQEVPVVVSEGDYYDRLMKWAENVGKKEDLTFVVVDGYPKSHYLDFEHEDVLGIVESIGGLGERPVIGMAKMIGADDFTVKIMIHEIGHLLGAEHIPFGIMAPTAQQNQYSEAYAIETIAQIKQYLESLHQK